MRRHFVAFLLLISCTEAQINNSGSVTAYVDSLITKIPDATPSDLYLPPNGTEKTTWESVVDDLMNGNASAAQTKALTINYDVVRFNDTTNGRTYSILRKKSAGENYWGTFIVDPNPRRSRLFIQIPHPVYDTKTGNQGIVVFKNTGAQAFIISGTHRCNSTQLSSCDGTTSVCSGTTQAFSSSDQAHTVNGTFQLTTALFMKKQSNAVIVQLHGFGKGTGDPDVILGNGTNKNPTGTDYLLLFRNALAELDPSMTFKTAHIDTAWTELTGTTNTQGRLINGSSNPCGTKASAASGRFLHIEQAFAKLRDNGASWVKVADAVAAIIPEDPTAVGTNDSESGLQFHLLGNYPNPFNPFTTISFTVKRSGVTTVKVYDMLGREVTTLLNEYKEAGLFVKIEFDAGNLTSGIYVAKLFNINSVQTVKMLFLK